MKKIVAMLLVVLLILPTTLWAQEMSKELTDTIVAVKEKVYVPNQLSEFEYNMTGEGETKLYHFTWHDKEYKLGRVQITAESDGNILTYSKNMYDEKYTVLANFSYEEGLKKAKSFIEQVAPNYNKQLKLVQEERGQGNYYNYVFDHYVNDIKVFGSKVSVNVSKQTGEVMHFSGLKSYRGDYEKQEAKISLEDAKKIYEEQLGAKVVYQIHYDYKTKSIRSFPVYTINNSQYKAIDAETGRLFKPFKVSDRYYREYNTQDVSMSGAKAESGLTPAEEKVVEETKELLTKQEAIDSVAKYFPKVNLFSLDNASLYKTTYDKEYIWNITGHSVDLAATTVPEKKALLMIAAGDTDSLPQGTQRYVSFSVNAKTGEVISYYYNALNVPYIEQASEVGDVPKVDEKVVKEKVEAFLKNIAKDKYSLTNYSKGEDIEVQPLKQNLHAMTYYYERLVDGVPVKGNGLRVTYDALEDEVTNYSMNWNTLDFKAVKDVVEEQKIIDQIGLELMYVNTSETVRSLGYLHEESTMAFDPFTGKRVNTYDGEPVMPNQTSFYDDIKGHPQEAIIKKLYDSGIYLSDKSFKPNQTINQYDFLRLILRENTINVSEEDLYNRATSQGIIEEKEKNKDLLMTKELAVKYLINSTAYKKVAQIEGIYNYPFEDEEEVATQLKGYVTLAYGLNIIKKDTTGQFNPKAELTRAGAAQMIYNMLLSEQND